jgi:hypothetical protein
VYRSYAGNDNPVVIKFTNFGLGCGKLPNLSLKEMALKDKQVNGNYVKEKCGISGLPLLDPYMSKFNDKISKIQNNKKLIKLGMRYDLFNIGLIGLMCICNKELYDKEFRNVDDYNNNLSRYLKSIKAWNSFLSLAKDNILDSDGFNLYFNNISKYCLGPISQRRDTRYVQNSILMLEKHKNL